MADGLQMDPAAFPAGGWGSGIGGYVLHFFPKYFRYSTITSQAEQRARVAEGLVMDPAELFAGPSVRNTAPHSLLAAFFLSICTGESHVKISEKPL